MSGDHRKDLYEHMRCSGYAKWKNPELVMGLSHCESEEFAMGGVNIHMKISIHIKSREPGPKFGDLLENDYTEKEFVDISVQSP